MADINVERKGASIWPWIIGLIILALLIWALAELFDTDEPEVAEVVEPAPIAAPVGPEPMAPVGAATPGIAEILANPSAYAGQTIMLDSLRVAEVTSDRGFWVEGSQAGQRMYVVKNESPQEGVADVQGRADVRPARNVNAGDMLRINGTVYQSAQMDNVQPPLDAQTRQILQDQQAFLQANVADIEHLTGSGAM